MDCNVFIIHGAEGHPKENWFPWLKKELELLDCKLFVPQFPTPKNQTLSKWLKVFDKYKNYINKNSIVVGHSLGVIFLLNILEVYSVRAAFFVAGFCSDPENELSSSMNTFTNKTFNWSKIKNNCKNFFIYQSDNDPYVPVSKGKELAKNLDSKLIIIKNAGHFNEESGYIKFELLLNNIKKVITKHL